MEAKNCRPNSLVPPDGSPSDPQPVPPASSIKTFVQTYECSTDLESNFHLSAFGQDAYIFKVHSIPIKLPEDYSAALNSLCEIASAKLINVEAGDSDTVSKKVGTLINAFKQIVYNFEARIDDIVAKAGKVFNDFHTQICDINISSISELIEEAKVSFKMKDQAKKKLIFTIKRDEEAQKFIVPFMNEIKINMSKFIELFNHTFSYFFVEKIDFSQSFERFDKKISEIKMNKMREYKEKFQCELFKYFNDECEYMRVAVYCAKITEDLKVKVNERFNWIMMTCFVMQQGECTLTKPVEISHNMLLIPLHFHKESYIIFYTPTHHPSVAKFAHGNSNIVVEGSTQEKVFLYVAKTSKIQEHCLASGKLNKKQDIDLLIKENELVNKILYISETERFLMIVNNTKLISRTIGSSVRNDLKFTHNDTELVSLSIYREKKFVCIKSHSIIKLYNYYLQNISSFNIDGNLLCGITTLADYGYVIIIAENRVIEVKLELEQDYNRQVSGRALDYKLINPCSNSMSKDRLDLIKNSSKYIQPINKNFSVPDKNPAFRQMNEQSLEPESIYFQSTDSNPVSVQPRISFINPSNPLQNLPRDLPNLPNLPSFHPNMPPNPIFTVPPCVPATLNLPPIAFQQGIPVIPHTIPKNDSTVVDDQRVSIPPHLPKPPSGHQSPFLPPTIPASLSTTGSNPPVISSTPQTMPLPPYLPPALPNRPPIPQNIPQGQPQNLNPEVPPFPPKHPGLHPNPQNLPPTLSNLPPGPPNLPQTRPQNPQNLPPGPPNLPPTPSYLPPGPPGPPGPPNLPQTRPQNPPNLPPGPPNLHPTPSNLPLGPPNISGLPTIPPSTMNLPNLPPNLPPSIQKIPTGPPNITGLPMNSPSTMNLPSLPPNIPPNIQKNPSGPPNQPPNLPSNIPKIPSGPPNLPPNLPSHIPKIPSGPPNQHLNLPNLPNLPSSENPPTLPPNIPNKAKNNKPSEGSSSESEDSKSGSED